MTFKLVPTNCSRCGIAYWQGQLHVCVAALSRSQPPPALDESQEHAPGDER